MIPVLAASLALAAPAAQSYRARFPLPGFTVPEGWGVNVHMRHAGPRQYDLLADLGVKWVRMDMLWSVVEKEPGVYDFSDYDLMLDRLRSRKIRALVILDYGNKLYDVDSPRTREGRDAFASYVRQAVRRYRGRGIVWEIWNEPNLLKFWKQPPSADEYAALVRVVGETVRDVAPDEWLAGPAVNKFDWPYLHRVFQEGALEYLDAVSVHPYRDHYAPETALSDWSRLRRMVDDYSPRGKRVALISGESGYSTASRHISPKKQADFAVRKYLTNLAAGVPMTIWYSWQNRGGDPKEKDHNYGLIDTKLQPKLVYRAVQNAIGQLKGYSFDTRLDLGNDSDHALLFSNGSRQKLAVWSSDDSERTVTLPSHIGRLASTLVSRGGSRTVRLRPSVQILELQ